MNVQNKQASSCATTCNAVQMKSVSFSSPLPPPPLPSPSPPPSQTLEAVQRTGRSSEDSCLLAPPPTSSLVLSCCTCSQGRAAVVPQSSPSVSAPSDAVSSVSCSLSGSSCDPQLSSHLLQRQGDGTSPTQTQSKDHRQLCECHYERASLTCSSSGASRVASLAATGATSSRETEGTLDTTRTSALGWGAQLSIYSGQCTHTYGIVMRNHCNSTTECQLRAQQVHIPTLHIESESIYMCPTLTAVPIHAYCSMSQTYWFGSEVKVGERI